MSKILDLNPRLYQKALTPPQDAPLHELTPARWLEYLQGVQRGHEAYIEHLRGFEEIDEEALEMTESALEATQVLIVEAEMELEAGVDGEEW
jgi:hypothetical protein